MIKKLLALFRKPAPVVEPDTITFHGVIVNKEDKNHSVLVTSPITSLKHTIDGKVAITCSVSNEHFQQFRAIYDDDLPESISVIDNGVNKIYNLEETEWRVDSATEDSIFFMLLAPSIKVIHGAF